MTGKCPASTALWGGVKGHNMEPHGLSPWYLHKNTLLRPWAPKRSRLREARYGGRRKVGAQAPRLRRVIRQWRNPPKQ
jgi:hypothetical protein